MSSGVPAADGLMRELIREVLRDLVREEVQRVLADLGGDIRRIPSSLSPAGPSAGPGRVGQPRAAAGTPDPGTRVERGPLTERLVEAARDAGEIRVARGVAITPLAKDRARALGVLIVREP
ncbi:MAG: hypothetical protein V9F00_12930 [Nocardioides sp.]